MELAHCCQVLVDLFLCVCVRDIVIKPRLQYPLCSVFPHVGGDVFFMKENASEATGNFPMLTWVRAETGSLSDQHRTLSGIEVFVNSRWELTRGSADPSPVLCLSP